MYFNNNKANDPLYLKQRIKSLEEQLSQSYSSHYNEINRLNTASSKQNQENQSEISRLRRECQRLNGLVSNLESELNQLKQGMQKASSKIGYDQKKLISYEDKLGEYEGIIIKLQNDLEVERRTNSINFSRKQETRNQKADLLSFLKDKLKSEE